ncbi:hypothetical protein FGIG_01439 [Fasciola gigantica]|uniref:Uncharacterized protein n=1 Tax=Fasciola gigantica TaxID=46835 RepID=A0A504YF67_FASGI|nr:hypothetical protein FGIG_01439 [Fasciola gigantica]
MQSNLLTLKNNANETQYAIQPIYSSDPSLPAGFSWTEYLSTLKTHVLGRALLWAESLPSSYSLGERLLPTLPADSGLKCSTYSEVIQSNSVGRNNYWAYTHLFLLPRFRVLPNEALVPG